MFKRREPATYNRITISAGALLHNAELVGKLTDRDVFPVLKGNAYGHGIEEVAGALKGFRTPYIAVNSYDEAQLVRSVTPRPVLVMGTEPVENLGRLPIEGLAFVVHDEASIHALGRRGRPVKLHLEVNTGLNRYGIETGQLKHVTELLKRYPKLAVEGLMSHLADADGPLPATVQTATARFEAAVEEARRLGLRPLHLHLANTAGAAHARSPYSTGIRLGIGLYGINPFPEEHPLHAALAGLRPVLEFTSTITDVHELEAGDHVGYNHTYTASQPMRIGVIPAGYYEGVNRALSNVGALTINGKPAQITGRVCMNHTMISLASHSKARLGETVTVISRRPQDPNAIARLADGHGLFSYNLLIALSADVPRQLVD